MARLSAKTILPTLVVPHYSGFQKPTQYHRKQTAARGSQDMLKEYYLFGGKLDADGAAKVAFLGAFFFVAGDIHFALRLTVAAQAAFAIEQGQHHTHGSTDGLAHDLVPF